MSLNQWNTAKIEQHKTETGQALLSDEQTLVSFGKDFGKIIYSPPSAVSIPKNKHELQSLILFANREKLPITIRGYGLSQGGQSLPAPGGLTLSMQNFTKTSEPSGDKIWVEANSNWSNLLEKSLPQHMAPFVLPYNCNLSIGGVLSVGGVGSASFKQGSISAHIAALEVIDGLGVIQTINENSQLFHASLSGLGRFSVITKACIQLRPIKQQVKTFFLVYADQGQWFEDINKIQDRIDYMELFCSPAVQGTQLKGDKRVPMVQWLYGMHLSVEYDDKSPDLDDVVDDLKPWNVINVQEESITSYLLRHNPRFEAMKMLGQWDLLHPWYECFVPTEVLKDNLTDLLHNLPMHYATLVHVVPIAKKKAGFLMFPKEDSICSLMILNPGIIDPMKDSCLKAIQYLDDRLLQIGGKRYLSGFLGTNLSKNYWKKHYGDRHDSWMDLKKQYDPVGIFGSMVHQTE